MKGIEELRQQLGVAHVNTFVSVNYERNYHGWKV